LRSGTRASGEPPLRPCCCACVCMCERVCGVGLGLRVSCRMGGGDALLSVCLCVWLVARGKDAGPGGFPASQCAAVPGWTAQPPTPPACRRPRRRRWAAVPESDWPASEAQRGVVLSDFDADGEYGDRRQVRSCAAARRGLLESACCCSCRAVLTVTAPPQLHQLQRCTRSRSARLLLPRRPHTASSGLRRPRSTPFHAFPPAESPLLIPAASTPHPRPPAGDCVHRRLHGPRRH
jgi:hypothetical protein